VNEVITAPLYSLGPSGCVATAPPGGSRQFALGEPVTLAMLARERAAGARIQPVSLTAGDVAAPDQLVFDSALAADCGPGQLDGTLRCLPPAPLPVIAYYLDDQCVTTIDIALVDESACTPTPRFAHGPTGLHAIGDRVTMPLYEISTGDRCVPYQPGAPPRRTCRRPCPAGDDVRRRGCEILNGGEQEDPRLAAGSACAGRADDELPRRPRLRAAAACGHPRCEPGRVGAARAAADEELGVAAGRR
jgi:hypothetical protein